MTDATWKCQRCGDRHPIPRDPSRYRATTHFQQRFKFRDVPAGRIADCVQEGDIKRTNKEHYRYLDYDDGLETWRILVALRPQAYHDDREHKAITIYPLSDPPDETKV